MKHMSPASNLDLEAQAFNTQIEERIAMGHIPDLRLCEPCDYFYNNSWRRPEFAKLDFGEQFTLIRDGLTTHLSQMPKDIRVLEVGCGPGYLSLELARSGFDVVGLDLSDKCIEVACRFADNDPWKAERGTLRYLSGDYFTSKELAASSFDAVVFLGALHHFPNQHLTLERARQLLKPQGLVFAHEPVRDRVARGNAAFNYFLSTLLSLNNNFFRHQALTTDPLLIESEINRAFHELRYEGNDGENLQSVNDNEAGYAEMYPILNSLFKEEHFCWRYAFFHEFIGGLRFDEKTNADLAWFLRQMDRILVESNVLPATEFFFIGRKL